MGGPTQIEAPKKEESRNLQSYRNLIESSSSIALVRADGTSSPIKNFNEYEQASKNARIGNNILIMGKSGLTQIILPAGSAISCRKISDMRLGQPELQRRRGGEERIDQWQNGIEWKEADMFISPYTKVNHFSNVQENGTSDAAEEPTSIGERLTLPTKRDARNVFEQAYEQSYETRFDRELLERQEQLMPEGPQPNYDFVNAATLKFNMFYLENLPDFRESQESADIVYGAIRNAITRHGLELGFGYELLGFPQAYQHH